MWQHVDLFMQDLENDRSSRIHPTLMTLRDDTPVCTYCYEGSVVQYAFDIVAKLHPSMHATLQRSYTACSMCCDVTV